MSQTTIHIQTDIELKTKAQSVLANLGLDMSTAVNAFLGKLIEKQAIPFETAKPSGKHAKLGGWEGKIWMSEDFNAPIEDFKEYME